MGDEWVFKTTTTGHSKSPSMSPKLYGNPKALPVDDIVAATDKQCQHLDEEKSAK